MADAEAPSQTRRVMICVDGSDHAKKAFDWYLNNVSHKGDYVFICFAPELHPPALPHALATEEWRHEVEKHEKKVKEVLECYKNLCETDGKHKIAHAKVEAISVTYSVGDTLCKEAEKEHVTMIVLGSRGMGLIRRTLLGSVSDYIIHHAHCPVVVVPRH